MKFGYFHSNLEGLSMFDSGSQDLTNVASRHEATRKVPHTRFDSLVGNDKDPV